MTAHADYLRHAAIQRARAADDARNTAGYDLFDRVDLYQHRALEFAFYPHISTGAMAEVPVYPALAMMGEIAELTEKMIDFLATPTDKLKELGDVLWYVAAAAKDLGSPLSNIVGSELWGPSPVLRYKWPAIEYTAPLFIKAGHFAEQFAKKPWRDGTPFDIDTARHALREVVVELRATAAFAGFTLGQVAQANIDKLVERRKRGTLTGSGDNR